jgi:phosphate starvation-inducible PhoH-like protein
MEIPTTTPTPTTREKKKASRANKRRLQQQIQNDYLNMYFRDTDADLDQHICSENPRKKNNNATNAEFMQPKNAHQTAYVELLTNPEKKIIVVSGPAGTGKTLFATEYGIAHLQSGEFDKLIFTRPSVSVDENLGYLPGSMEEKMAPWIRPIYDILYQHYSPTEVDDMLAQKTIEIAPLGFMRGRTFKNSWIVADEMQNSTVGQMKMLLTRLGENSRLVVTGDLEQHDRPNEINGLDDFLSKFQKSGKRSSSISSMEFQTEDVQRERVVKEVLDLYSASYIPTYIEDTTTITTTPTTTTIVQQGDL